MGVGKYIGELQVKILSPPKTGIQYLYLEQFRERQSVEDSELTCNTSQHLTLCNRPEKLKLIPGD